MATSSTALALRWVGHDPTFSSLMLGRIELAQISMGDDAKQWFYVLRFCQEGERQCFSAESEAEAKAVAEAHASKVLFMTDSPQLSGAVFLERRLGDSCQALFTYERQDLPQHLQWTGEGPPPASWRADDHKAYRSYRDFCEGGDDLPKPAAIAGSPQ